MYSRIILNMYMNQKLRGRWNSVFSKLVYVKDGVKQAWVISLILFCIYINYVDGLLNDLTSGSLGCYMGDM